MSKKQTTKSKQSATSSYSIESDIPLSSWSTFDTTTPEFVTMSKMQVNQSFPFPEARKAIVEAARLHLKRNNNFNFAIRQERDHKTKAIIPERYRVWRTDEAITRKPYTKRVAKE